MSNWTSSLPVHCWLMALDPDRLRAAFAAVPTAVTVVATRHAGGGVCGLTANAFMTVSLAPPLVMVSVDLRSRTLPCIDSSGVVSVNALAADQADIARRFAERREDKFDGIAHSLSASGCPILDGAVLGLDCVVETSHDGGDHRLILARPVDLFAREGMPLVFHRRGYTTVAPEEGGHGGE